MADQTRDENVVGFPKVETTSEEKARRVMVEATRLASLTPGEWRLWIDGSAERLGIPRHTLEQLVVTIIKDSDKKAREIEAEARRQEARIEKKEAAARREQEQKRKREQARIDKEADRKRKEKAKAFKILSTLPSEQHEVRLAELAKRLDEDVAALRDDFTSFVGMEIGATSMESWHVE